MNIVLSVFAGVLLLATLAGCRTSSINPEPPIVQPGAPGQPARVLTAEKALALPQPRYTDADVKFMQGMISHHAQALEMTALLPTRSSDADMKKLAHRIELSQADEIKMMQEWLRARGQQVPDQHAIHQHGATLMPGMLTPDEMTRLAAAKDREFDRLFLEGMIKHHAGALTMVEELFKTPGAGQEGDIFAFASDVEADQRMEIERMGVMLRELMK